MRTDDKEIERMMNEDGMTHAEAEAAYRKKAKNMKEPKESMGGVALPASLLPDVPTGKEVDVSICGTVTGKSNGMVNIKTRRFSVNVMEPMPESTKAVNLR